MGCSNGVCGLRPRNANAGCGVCDQDRYRLAMRSMFNPWANAGKILPGGGSETYVGGDTSTQVGDKGGGGGGGGGSSNQGAYDLAGRAIQEIGATARAQMAADTERARREADARAAEAERMSAYGADGTRSTQYRTETSTPQPSSGGGSSMLLLALLAAGAAVMTGAVKLPKM